MKLSIYTFIRNGLFMDFHTVAMLRHHLPLADEIVVNEGMSTDGTYEAIRDIDPKIRILRERWDQTEPDKWHIKFKDRARQECTGDWCILLDSDEFIPEWEFGRLRQTLETTSRDLLGLRFVHFYGNYRVYKARHELIKHTPIVGMRIHRNLDNVLVWGDGANVRLADTPYHRPDIASAFECHHFGEVRHAARLRQKWRTQAKQHHRTKPVWDWLPAFVFDLFPHAWCDPHIFGDLDIYDGPLIQAVHDDPKEFVRDDFQLLEQLRQRPDRIPESS